MVENFETTLLFFLSLRFTGEIFPVALALFRSLPLLPLFALLTLFDLITRVILFDAAAGLFLSSFIVRTIRFRLVFVLVVELLAIVSDFFRSLLLLSLIVLPVVVFKVLMLANFRVVVKGVFFALIRLLMREVLAGLMRFVELLDVRFVLIEPIVADLLPVEVRRVNLLGLWLLTDDLVVLKVVVGLLIVVRL